MSAICLKLPITFVRTEAVILNESPASNLIIKSKGTETGDCVVKLLTSTSFKLIVKQPDRDWET